MITRTEFAPLTEPITPKQARERHSVTIPNEVITAINDLLVENASESCTRIVITQDEIISRATFLMAEHDKTVSRNDFFDRRWLDFEPIFRKAGWKVEYTRPGYNESFTAYWTFES